MQSEDRLIHFSTELIHRPKKHDRKDLQKLYYELSQTPGAGYDTSDFSNAVQTRFVSRRSKRTQSICMILADRIVLVEEWADMALCDFTAKVSAVALQAMAVLGIGPFVVQTATLRSTFALTHFADARTFLLDHACNQENRIEPFFQRPIGSGGLRFSLPETPQNRGSLNVIIESFKHSNKEIFVEVKGLFKGPLKNEETMADAVENIEVCRAFITDNIYPFLNQYDTPKEGLV